MDHTTDGSQVAIENMTIFVMRDLSNETMLP